MRNFIKTGGHHDEKRSKTTSKRMDEKLDKNYIEKADQSIFEQVKELKRISRGKNYFLLCKYEK